MADSNMELKTNFFALYKFPGGDVDDAPDRSQLLGGFNNGVSRSCRISAFAGYAYRASKGGSTISTLPMLPAGEAENRYRGTRPIGNKAKRKSKSIAEEKKANRYW
jgi:hypothetical protein